MYVENKHYSKKPGIDIFFKLCSVDKIDSESFQEKYINAFLESYELM